MEPLVARCGIFCYGFILRSCPQKAGMEPERSIHLVDAGGEALKIHCFDYGYTPVDVELKAW